MHTPDCPYCGAKAKLHQSSAKFYRGTDYGPVWACPNDACDAYVGCHKGTTEPLGRLANKELRLAKSAAHRAFDPLWRKKIAREGCAKKKARGAGYKWLAEQLGIAREDCHIGMFDVTLCKRVVEICGSLARSK